MCVAHLSENRDVRHIDEIVVDFNNVFDCRARVGKCAIAVASGDQWLRAAAEHVDLCPDARRRDDATVEAQLAWANMTRLAIERVCLDVMERVERSVGARGLLRPWPFERVLRDLTLYLRQPAPDAALDQVGRQLLEGAE